MVENMTSIAINMPSPIVLEQQQKLKIQNSLFFR